MFPSSNLKSFKFIPNKSIVKIPLILGWSKDGKTQQEKCLAYDSPELKKFLDNGAHPAIVTGAGDGLIVVDVDDERVNKIAEEYLPQDTYIESTPTGGRHYLLLCPEITENIKVSNGLKGKDEIIYAEILANAHQCHVWPSKAKNKKTGEIVEYKILSDREPKRLDKEIPLNFLEKVKQTFNANESGVSSYEEEKKKSEFDFNYDNLEYPTCRLNGFQYLDQASKLKGKEYLPHKKGMWYQSWGLPFRNERIEVNEIVTDWRFNLNPVIPHGGGKQLIANCMTDIAKGLGLKVVAPTSLHAEQLVGKTVRHKATKNQESWVEYFKGHLAGDMVNFNEGMPLFEPKTPGQEDVCAYLLTALNPIGENTIVKKMVEFHDDEALTYDPICCVNIFLQPYSVPAKLVLSGMKRRLRTIYRPLGGIDKTDAYLSRLTGDGFKPKNSLDRFINIIQQTTQDFKKKESGIHIPENLLPKIHEHHQTLINFGKSISPKCQAYLDATGFNLQNVFIQMIVINTFSQCKTEVDELTIDSVFVDLFELLFGELHYIESKVNGAVDYGEDWGGAVGKRRICLEWLFDNNAISEKDSLITIESYLKKIGEVYNLESTRQARNLLKKQKEDNVVDSKSKKGHSSVWLTLDIDKIRGKRGNGGEGGERGERGYEIYHTLCDKIEASPISANHSFPLFSEDLLSKLRNDLRNLKSEKVSQPFFQAYRPDFTPLEVEKTAVRNGLILPIPGGYRVNRERLGGISGNPEIVGGSSDV